MCNIWKVSIPEHKKARGRVHVYHLFVWASWVRDGCLNGSTPKGPPADGSTVYTSKQAIFLLSASCTSTLSHSFTRKKHLSIFCAEGHTLASLTRVNRTVASLVHSQKTHLFSHTFRKETHPAGVNIFARTWAVCVSIFTLATRLARSLHPSGVHLVKRL